MKEVLAIFLRAPGARPLSVLICLLLAGIFNLLSIGMLLPLISIAGGITTNKPSSLSLMVTSVSTWLGVKPDLNYLLLFLAISLSIKSILSFLAMSYAAVAMAEVSAQVRRLLVSAMLRVRWSYYTENHPGTLSHAISSEAAASASAYSAAANTVAEAVKGAISLLIAVLVSGTFFAVAAVGAACVAFPMTWLIKSLRRNKKRQWKYTSKLVDDAQDAFSNIKALRSMQRQGVFEQLFTTNIGRVRKSLIRHQITRQALTHGQDLLMALTICAGIYAGAVLYRVPLPELLVLGVIFTQIIACIKGFQSNYQLFMEHVHGYRFCMKVIAQAKALEESDFRDGHPDLRSRLPVRSRQLLLQHMVILDEVSLDIPARKIAVFTGPSGAGKTTIVDLLVGFPPADQRADPYRWDAPFRCQSKGLALEYRLCAAGAYPAARFYFPECHDGRPVNFWRGRTGSVENRRPSRLRGRPDRRCCDRCRTDGKQVVRRPAPTHLAGACPGSQTSAANSR